MLFTARFVIKIHFRNLNLLSFFWSTLRVDSSISSGKRDKDFDIYTGLTKFKWRDGFLRWKASIKVREPFWTLEITDWRISSKNADTSSESWFSERIQSRRLEVVHCSKQFSKTLRHWLYESDSHRGVHQCETVTMENLRSFHFLLQYALATVVPMGLPKLNITSLGVWVGASSQESLSSLVPGAETVLAYHLVLIPG